MLPAAHRLTRAPDFRRAARGRRASSRLVVLTRVAGSESGDDVGSGSAHARVGFVVSRAVGGSVVRNRVRRRLRHLMAQRLASLERGDLVVVRALPASAAASSAQLAADLDRLLAGVVAPVRP